MSEPLDITEADRVRVLFDGGEEDCTVSKGPLQWMDSLPWCVYFEEHGGPFLLSRVVGIVSRGGQA